MSRTFQREAQRLIRECGLGEPAVDRLGDSLFWVLFATGQLGKRRRHGHGKAWRQRAFYGGSDPPHAHPEAPPVLMGWEATSAPAPVVASGDRSPDAR